MEKIKNIKKGEFFKRNEKTNIVYVRGDYCREEKKYECYKFDDVNSFVYLKGGKEVVVDFEF